MRAVIGAIALLLSTHALPADVPVQGYFRANGTYVQPAHRSAPDGNPYNNYSTQGNVNPYTGQPGTVNPYMQPPAPPPPVAQPVPQPYYQYGCVPGPYSRCQ